MNFLNLYSLPPLISAILFIFLGGWVFLSNRKSIVNFTFFLLCFVTFWWQFSWFVLFNTQNEELAQFLVKFGHIGIIFIPIFFFHFIVSFLGEKSKFDKYLLYFAYFAGALFEFILFPTNYFINGFYQYFWGFYPKAGPFHPFYLLILSFISIRIFYLLVFSLKKTQKLNIQYSQRKYLLLAYTFYVFAVSDFLINYGIEFYPMGFLFILFFL